MTHCTPQGCYHQFISLRLDLEMGETYHLYCAMVSIYGPAAVNKLPKLSFLLYGQLWPQLSKLLYLLIPDNFFRAISSVRNGSTVITLNCMKFRFRFRVYLKLLQNSQPLFKSPNIDKVVRIPKNSDIQNFQKLICDHDLLETVIKQPQQLHSQNVHQTSQFLSTKCSITVSHQITAKIGRYSQILNPAPKINWQTVCPGQQNI